MIDFDFDKLLDEVRKSDEYKEERGKIEGENMNKQEWRKKHLNELKEAIKEWRENRDNMQDSYPRGLSQFIEESNYIYGSLCDYIAELN